MRKILTTAVVVVELVAVSAGAAFAASSPVPAPVSASDSVWARNAAAAVAIQQDYEIQSENAAH